ncbi:fluoride efflux transporter CrcB [Flavobacterium salilacus subsp. salilacus]|uniref:fluoride efflux transporter CrcB n=1 Tax=Flavobacterium TaxID=237 RepID=UPI001074CDBD|nr:MULTISPECIES: fluoride efflux transporter CrcB [Flavobacterium]KAF2516255.1 fluoride efflux transporter CrcB [Flavobacterium salilacus subsp. salilacus]MBE1613783.1 fluoride efflux transporter CrcB [Flavobacterium sp. SaA2.13]NDI99969.1 fluoride efflux transporter CrcB [Flavobacterium salilacus subsp. altitudinum]
MLKSIVLVGLGGAIGSIFRYLSSLLITKYFSSIFPLATFTVNIIGCFLIGLIFGYMEKEQIASDTVKYLFITGFCGGYTTFSTFAIENVGLLQGQHTLTAFAYIAASIIAGLFAVWLGLLIFK